MVPCPLNFVVRLPRGGVGVTARNAQRRGPSLCSALDEDLLAGCDRVGHHTTANDHLLFDNEAKIRSFQSPKHKATENVKERFATVIPKRGEALDQRHNDITVVSGQTPLVWAQIDRPFLHDLRRRAIETNHDKAR